VAVGVDGLGDIPVEVEVGVAGLAVGVDGLGDVAVLVVVRKGGVAIDVDGFDQLAEPGSYLRGLSIKSFRNGSFPHRPVFCEFPEKKAVELSHSLSIRPFADLTQPIVLLVHLKPPG
jgi:hypothetical protein